MAGPCGECKYWIQVSRCVKETAGHHQEQALLSIYRDRLVGPGVEDLPEGLRRFHQED